MTSRLALEPITLAHGNIAVRLRPSLRAGYLIAQKYSLDDLRDILDEIRFSDIVYLVNLGCDDENGTADLIAKLTTEKGLSGLYDFVPGIRAFIEESLGLVSSSDRAGTEGQSQAHFDEPDFIAEFEGLYEFATGWLYWTPAETWAATPTEIHAARKGHFAMLRAIHGDSSERTPQDKPQTAYTADDMKRVEELGYDPAFERDKLRSLNLGLAGGA